MWRGARSILLALVPIATLSGVVLPPATASARNLLPPCPSYIEQAFWSSCKGTATEPNGDKYVGEWNLGQWDGYGTLTFATGVKVVGEFQDGWVNGQATETWPDGLKYVGQFKDGKKNGQGTVTSPDGLKYVGQFKDGDWSGRGTMTRPNGLKYVGQFKDGKWNGQATLIFPDGRRYVGQFKDNKRNGQGTEYLADGSIGPSGLWADGEFVGASAPAASPTRSAGGTEVALLQEGGTFAVPVIINGGTTLNFTLDSGASDVSIPVDVVMTLFRAGTLDDTDFLGAQTYRLADGSTMPSTTFRIRSLKVGNTVLENVTGSVAPVAGGLLLGQSFLTRFKSWSIDNQRQVLILN